MSSSNKHKDVRLRRNSNNRNSKKRKSSEFFYDNSTSSYDAVNVKEAIDELQTSAGSPTVAAEDVSYDNSTSGISATDVQAAIDEIDTTVSGLSSTTTEMKRAFFISPYILGTEEDWEWSATVPDELSNWYSTDASVVDVFGSSGNYSPGNDVFFRAFETGKYLLQLWADADVKSHIQVRGNNGAGGVLFAEGEDFKGSQTERLFEAIITVTSATALYFYNTDTVNTHQLIQAALTKISEST